MRKKKPFEQEFNDLKKVGRILDIAAIGFCILAIIFIALSFIFLDHFLPLYLAGAASVCLSVISGTGSFRANRAADSLAMRKLEKKIEELNAKLGTTENPENKPTQENE